MLENAGKLRTTSTGSKKASLPKLMTFGMIEPGYPMNKEIMLEPGSIMAKDISFCNVAFFAPVEAADACPAVSSMSAAEFDRTRKTFKKFLRNVYSTPNTGIPQFPQFPFP